MLESSRASSEYPALFRLGLPVLVTQLGIIVVSFADTMMVGRYGTPELASAAFVNSMFVVAFVMLIGFAGGLTPLVGALFGQKRMVRAGMVFKAGLISNVMLSLLFMMVMGGLYFVLPRFGQDEALLPIIRPYYLIVLVSLLPSAVFNACQQTANGSTDTAMPMWIMLSGNVLNILGNWVLIWGKFGMPEMGLLGAGISTLVSRTYMAAVIIIAMAVRKRYRPHMEGLRKDIRGEGIVKRVVYTSVPIMVQSGVECLMWTVGAIVCGEFGRNQIAAYQIVNIIGQLGFMIYISFSTATSIRVSNYTGQEDAIGVKSTVKAGLNLGLVLGTLSSLIFIFLSKPLIWMFTEDQAVTAVALTLIPPLVIYQYCDAVQLNYVNALRGMAEVKPLLVISVVSYIIIGMPALWLLSKVMHMESLGVYYSFSAALLSAALLLYAAYRRHYRRRFFG
ncbi:MAG: MATE family efflux transporter [Muribaculum sp.]|nr:MATE family efflux transporter [Muribaculum sp.]